MRIFLVAGARPNFMKISPLMEEIKRHPEIETTLVHTGQHYDEEMSEMFFKDLALPEPDIYLGIGSGTHAGQTAGIMIEFEKVCMDKKPDIVVVVGDVNSTLACSIAAVKLDYGGMNGRKGKSRPLIAHVEAGLRSFDRTMPEEINRVITDSLSDFLFTTCADANENLRKEGVPEERIHFVGNVMIDTLLKFKAKARVRSKIKTDRRDYALLTLHRPSNVDDKETFENILMSLREISRKIPIIFPAHPRTRGQIDFFGYQKSFYYIKLDSTNVIRLTNSINLLPSLSYLDFLNLMSNSKFVLTDSGGIQEETSILGIPCLTIRENTERPVTIKEGTNELVGMDLGNIVKQVNNILNNCWKKGRVPELWDGKAAQRIVSILAEKYENTKSRSF